MPSHVPPPDRSPTLQVNIKNLIDEVQCYQTIRDLRWPDGIACPSCASQHVIKRGFDDTEPARQRYECHNCNGRFDDLTDTIFAGHHQPLKVWVLCLYFMGRHWFSVMGTAKFRGFVGKLGSCRHIIIDPIYPEMRSMPWNFYDSSARYATLLIFDIIRPTPQRIMGIVSFTNVSTVRSISPRPKRLSWKA